MLNRRVVLLLLAVASLLLAGGCGGRGDAPISDETSDPDYRRGLEFKRQGRGGDALDSFFKVIDRRGVNGAPESHLEAGALLLHRDPFEAYHHFTRYLALQPTGPNAAMVEGQRNAAKREMARILILPPGENPDVRLEGGDVEQLRRRIQELEAENRTLQGASSTPVLRAPPVIALGDEQPGSQAATPNGVAEPRISVAPLSISNLSAAAAAAAPAAEPQHAEPAPARPQAQTMAARPVQQQSVEKPAPTRPAAAQAAQPAQPGRRTHTVSQGESLWQIARKYYGPNPSTAKVQGIYAANRDVMRNAGDLKSGMVLRIP